MYAQCTAFGAFRGSVWAALRASAHESNLRAENIAGVLASCL